jgi:hypothetical protein
MKASHAFASITKITIETTSWADIQACTVSTDACICSEILLCLLAAKIGYHPVQFLSAHWTGVDAFSSRIIRFISIYCFNNPFVDADLPHIVVAQTNKLKPGGSHVRALELKLLPCRAVFL